MATINDPDVSVDLRPAKPCSHTCFNHVTHACEKCGRYQGFDLQELLGAFFRLSSESRARDVAYGVISKRCKHVEELLDRLETIVSVRQAFALAGHPVSDNGDIYYVGLYWHWLSADGGESLMFIDDGWRKTRAEWVESSAMIRLSDLPAQDAGPALPECVQKALGAQA